MSENGLCGCGCGEVTNVASRTTTARGVVKGQHFRYIMGHNRRSSPVEYLEEDHGHDTPCWVWQRAKNQYGYAIQKPPRGSERSWLVHRVKWEEQNGPIPDGLDLDHLCRVRACVRPSHQQPVTRKENLRRGAGRGGVLSPAKKEKVNV